MLAERSVCAVYHITHFGCIHSFCLHKNTVRYDVLGCLQFSGEEMEAQRDRVACPKSHSCWVAEEEVLPRPCVSRVPLNLWLYCWNPCSLLWDSFSLEGQGTASQ